MALVFKQQSSLIIGACIEVHRRQGSGFLETVYQECLEIEFGLRGVDFIPQPELTLSYRDRPLRVTYRPDFVCFGAIIVEIKAASELHDNHRAQVLNYLRSTGFRLGLLVNFGSHPTLEFQRLVN